MNRISDIMLRRKNMIIPEKLPEPKLDLSVVRSKDEVFSLLPDETKNMILAVTVAKNMEALGYTPDKSLLEKMMQDNHVTAQVSEYIIPALRKLKGADVDYRPMYPNFPKQVMDMDEATLYFNALVHYITDGALVPDYEKEERAPLDESVKLQKISLGNDADGKKAFAELLNSVVPYSPQDKEDIPVFMNVYKIKEAMPESMVNRENVATLAGILYEQRGANGLYCLTPQIKNANDVLRIANLMHGNKDESLSEMPKAFGSFSRPERRVLLSMVNNCPYAAQEMKVNATAWIRLGEKLHPGEYKEFPKAAKAFDSIRDKAKSKEVHTFNAVIENAVKSGDIQRIGNAMMNNPGMFARNLDRLLRSVEQPQYVLDMWQESAKKVSPNLLWQVYSHFDRKIKDADEQNKFRVFTIKGKVPKTKVIPDETTPIPKEICEKVKSLTKDALIEIYKDKPPMGKVYIDPSVSECKVPNGTRTASKSASLAKGSRIPLGDNAKVIRGFMWWTNLNNGDRLDVDLSAFALDKNLRASPEVITYYNLKTKFGHHSGDIVNGGDFDGKGAAEFVDIDLQKAQEQGIKYIGFSVHAFSRQNFDEAEHLHFGYMERENMKSGEIFEPSTVQTCIHPGVHATIDTMCMIDVETKELIWVDAPIEARSSTGLNNVEGTKDQMTQMLYSALHLEKPNIKDVIEVNVLARGGELVDNKEDADTIFALTEGIRPTDLTYFSGNLLPKDVSKEFLPSDDKEKHEIIIGDNDDEPAL